MKIRTVLQKTRKGYAIRSFDFTSNTLEPFEGKGALLRAANHALKQGYNLINTTQHIPVIFEEDDQEAPAQ